MINLPIPFPSEQEKLEQEVNEFRKLTSTEQFLRIMQLSAFCELMLQQSPEREAILAQRQLPRTNGSRFTESYLNDMDSENYTFELPLLKPLQATVDVL